MVTPARAHSFRKYMCTPSPAQVWKVPDWCVQSDLTKDVFTHALVIDRANYIVLGVSFIAAPRTAALSYRKPASAGRRIVSAAVLGKAIKETHCIKKKRKTSLCHLALCIGSIFWDYYSRFWFKLYYLRPQKTGTICHRRNSSSRLSKIMLQGRPVHDDAL